MNINGRAGELARMPSVSFSGIVARQEADQPFNRLILTANLTDFGLYIRGSADYHTGDGELWEHYLNTS